MLLLSHAFVHDTSILNFVHDTSILNLDGLMMHTEMVSSHAEGKPYCIVDANQNYKNMHDCVL